MTGMARIRVGVALTLATIFAVLGIGLNASAKLSHRATAWAARGNRPHTVPRMTASAKSTFTVNGVPPIVDEETVIYG